MSITTLAEVKAAKTIELVELYNKLSGKPAIKKFADRKTAEERTWKIIQETTPIQVNKKPTTPGKRAEYEDRIIQILVETNPKREGTQAHKKFAVLLKMNNKTIRELKAQEGHHANLDTEAGWPSTELRWAVKLGLAKTIVASSAVKAA
jgi:hypothetical protein